MQDYLSLIDDVKPQSFYSSMQIVYVQSLRKMAHIRSYFGIEREFNRYYERLRN